MLSAPICSRTYSLVKRRTIVDIDQLITLSLFYTLSLCILVDFYMLGIGFYAIKHRFYGYKGKLG